MKHIVLLILLTAIGPAAAGPSTNEDFRFAEYLYAEHDFSRAVDFYKRSIFFPSNPAMVSLAHYRIGMCFQKEKQVNDAIVHFLKATNDSTLKAKSLFQIGNTKYLAGYYAPASADLDRFSSDHPRSGLADRALLLSGRACLQDFRWQDAADRMSRLSELYPDSPFITNALLLKKDVLVGLKLPRKHPWLSGIMSAILPGSGQFYCNRYVDGATALFLNAAFLSLTIFSASNPDMEDWYAYVSGGFFGAFYLANIYGAVNAAQNGSMIIRYNYRDSLLRKYPAPTSLDLSGSFSIPF